MDALAAARQALRAGRRDEAIELLEAQVRQDGAAPVESWRLLAAQLFRAGRLANADTRAAQGLVVHPDDFELLNTRGVILRRLGRLAEAVVVLERAIAMHPAALAAQENLFNVLIDQGEAARAETVALDLTQRAPGDAGQWRRLGAALARQGKAAEAALRKGAELAPLEAEAWIELSQHLTGQQRIDEAVAALDQGLAHSPADRPLLEAKSTLLRRTQRFAQAATFLDACQAAHPAAAWVRHQRGLLLSYSDRSASNTELEAALTLEPNNFAVGIALVEGYARDPRGEMGSSLQRAYELALALLPRNTDRANKALSEVLGRVCDFDAVDALGDFRTMGRGWAQASRPSALLEQLSRVTGEADRLELLEQHRIWGRNTEAWAARRPIAYPQPRPAGGRVRLGFMSSDLRGHVVAKFATPLFDHLDRDRFEVFAYSYYPGAEDEVQRRIAGQVAAFRWWPVIETREAAQRIADDQLDVLIELGGPTMMNRLEVMAFRPAPVQVSWLGYPHSAGLGAIDHFICDRFNAPARPELMLERPLLMPETWVSFGQRSFPEEPASEALPEDRHGWITFGTANNPYKFNRRLLQTWARIVHAVPNARFAIIRPECGAAGFRANIQKAFAAEGVSADRLVFRAVQGAHLVEYNGIDISLDTFPLTGGTTTAECLWMGVPLVSLVGPAFYERLSYSILSNAGLADLCADTLEAYHALALELAADHDRRVELRATLRGRIRSGPLCDNAGFARDFYDLIHRTVREAA